MTITVERVSLAKRESRTDNFEEFVKVAEKLEVGESFLFKLTSNHRMALSVIQYLTANRYVTRHENGQHRVCRCE